MRLFRATGAVGVELDTGIIRAVELKGPAHNPSVIAAGKIEIPVQAVEEGSVKDIQAVIDGLNRLWDKYQFDAGNIVLGVSNQDVMMRKANFPKGVGKNIARVVKFQAPEFFPIDLSQLVLDFTVLGEVDGERGPELEVLLVAVRKDSLSRSLAPFAEAGLEPRIVDYSPLALIPLLSASQLKKNIVILNISNGLTSFLLVADGAPRFSRAIPFSLSAPAAGDEIFLTGFYESLEETAAVVEMSGEVQALGVESEWGIALANEIRTSINYYITQQDGDYIDLLVLSGQGASLPGLTELLQGELEVPVEMISVPEGPDFAVCYGLACRGLGGK